MKSKQGLLQPGDRRHRGDGGSRHIPPSPPPPPPVITDSAAQMAEAQPCNNSIKLTFLCFPRVRHTRGHPLEFLTHSGKTNIAVKVRTAACVCWVPGKASLPSGDLTLQKHSLTSIRSGGGIGRSEEAAAAGIRTIHLESVPARTTEERGSVRGRTGAI